MHGTQGSRPLHCLCDPSTGSYACACSYGYYGNQFKHLSFFIYRSQFDVAYEAWVFYLYLGCYSRLAYITFLLIHEGFRYSLVYYSHIILISL